MTQLKRDLKAISKSLKQLTLRTEKIAKKLGKLEKPKPVKKPKAKAKPKVAKKPTENKTPKRTVVGAVMGVIRASKKGVSVVQIMEQTGLKKEQIWPTISRAKRQGTVKIVKKGIYVKA